MPFLGKKQTNLTLDFLLTNKTHVLETISQSKSPVFIVYKIYNNMNLLKNIIDFLKNVVLSVKTFFTNVFTNSDDTTGVNDKEDENTQQNTDNDENYVNDELMGKFNYWVRGDGVKTEFKEEAKNVLKDYRKEYDQLIEEICSGKKTLLLYSSEIEKIWDLDSRLINCGFVIRTYDEFGNLTFLGSEITETKQDILDGLV